MKAVPDMPEVSVAHVTLSTPCMADSIRFMLAVGMKTVFEGTDVSILELRGGTHLLLFPCDKSVDTAASFDLMTDDIHALHRKLTQQGYAPAAIEDRPQIGHESFEVRDPSGARITCFSSHATCRL